MFVSFLSVLLQKIQQFQSIVWVLLDSLWHSSLDQVENLHIKFKYFERLLKDLLESDQGPVLHKEPKEYKLGIYAIDVDAQL